MATQTPNLGLAKPAGNERPLISVLNGNADKIDAAIGDVDVTQDGSLQDQIDSIQDSVAPFEARETSDWLELRVEFDANNLLDIYYDKHIFA